MYKYNSFPDRKPLLTLCNFIISTCGGFSITLTLSVYISLILTFTEVCPSFTHQPPAGFQIRHCGDTIFFKNTLWAAQRHTPTALSLTHNLTHSHMHNSKITHPTPPFPVLTPPPSTPLPTYLHLQPCTLQDLGQPYQTPECAGSFSSLVCV